MKKILSLFVGIALFHPAAQVSAQEVLTHPVPELYNTSEDNLRAEIEILRRALQDAHAELRQLRMQVGTPDTASLSATNEKGLQAVLEGDYETAVLHFREGFKHDYLPAVSNLGLMYLNGTGVPKDYRQATRLLERAARAGNMVAAENLGRAYEFGLAVGFNRHKAIEWYQRAEQMGSPQAREAIQRLKQH